MSQDDAFNRAIELIDAANREDPNQEIVDGKACPKESLYSQRMSDMLQRYAPEADEAIQLAVRTQHIERWKSPRDAYPAGRKGYLHWRKDLYKFHADTAAGLLAQAGCNEEAIERVKQAVSKQGIKSNPDTQLLEDVIGLVFIEHYMEDFAARHPDYDEAKWLDIIRKTWKKMSPQANEFALSGSIRLPQPLVPLIQKAISAN